MSNILTVQDNNNELGIGSSFISLGTNNDLQFTYDNNTLLQFNTSNNTLNVGTVEQSTWNGTAIGTSYGGTGLTSIGSAGQVLSVKSDNSGLEWKTVSTGSGNINLESSIATEAQSTVTIGNINQPLTINTSANFLISLANSTPSTNQILGYSNNSVKFIDESTSNSSIGTTDDLWNLVNYFYPSYKYLLMNLVVKTSTNSQNLISFNSTTYNYSLTLVNTFSSIIIIPSVFNDSSIKLSNDTSSNNLNTYQTITNNSINTITLTNSITSNQKICNFNLKIADSTNNIYTIQIIQKSITVEITGYKTATDRANSITNNNNTNSFISGNYYNDVIYIKIKFSENVTNFDINDITVNNGSINSTFSGSNDTYLCTLTSNNIQNNTCEILVNSNVISDNSGNINSVSNTFSFIYDTVHPTMTIKGYSNYDNSNNTFSNEITHNSTLNASHSATIFIKFESSENTDDFIENHIEEVNGTLASFQAISSKIYVCEFTCNSGNSTNICSISVLANKFSDQATNTNLNNPSNTFSLIYDNTAPTLTTVTLQSNNTDSTKAINGNTITLSITASETITTPTVSFTIGSTNVSPSVSGSGTSYTATYTVQSGQNGSLSFTISSFADSAGNNGSNVTTTTNGSSITVILPGLLGSTNNAIAAYALIKLYDNYVGPTAQVLFSSGKRADLYFDSGGNIILIKNPPNLNTLNDNETNYDTLKNGGDVRILYLYDQSGNNNHLEPAAAAPGTTYAYGPKLEKRVGTGTAQTNSIFGDSRYVVNFRTTNNEALSFGGSTQSALLGTSISTGSTSLDTSHTIITAYNKVLYNDIPEGGDPSSAQPYGILFAIGKLGTQEPSSGKYPAIMFNPNIGNGPDLTYPWCENFTGHKDISNWNSGLAANVIQSSHIAYRYAENPNSLVNPLHRDQISVFKQNSNKIDTTSTSANLINTTIGSSIKLDQGGDYKQKLIIGDDERSTNYGKAGSLHYRGTRFKGDLYHFILYDTALENSQIEDISELLGSAL